MNHRHCKPTNPPNFTRAPGVTDTPEHPISRVIFAGFDPIMRMPEIGEVTGLGPSMIYKLMSRGEFPKSTPLTPAGRARGWRQSEVAAWVNNRAAPAHGQNS